VLKYRENVPSKSQQRHFDKREMSLGETKRIISLKFYRTKPHSISSSQTALYYYYHYHLQKIRPDSRSIGRRDESRDHPLFRGLSEIAQSKHFTEGGGVVSVRPRWSRRESPRECALSCQREYKFPGEADDALRGEFARVRRFAISHYPLFAASLTR